MTLTAITMPKWGLTMTEGKVVGWSRPQGAAIALGDALLEIETSKITNVMEAESPGTLLRIVAKEGATLPVGALLAVTGPAAAPEAEIDTFVAGFVVEEPDDSEDDGAAPPSPRDIDVAGTKLRYLELGSGDATPVLLLHGFGSDLNSWLFTQPALAEGRRVVALDLPGHGGSSRDVGAGDIDTFTNAVEGFVTAVALGPVHMVGHSMGGAIAASLARRRPDLVASLTLIAPAGLGAEINAAFIDGFVAASRRKDAIDVLRLLVHDPALVSRSMIEDVLRFKRLDGVAAALGTIAKAWFPEGRQTFAMGAVPVPILAIWGREDQIVPVAHAAAAPPGSEIHILEAAGHLPHMEKSADVNRLIRRFIGD